MTILRIATLISCLFGSTLLMRCTMSSTSPQQATTNKMQTKVDNISREVVRLRGMNFIRPVHVGVISREAYSASVNQSLSGSLSGPVENAVSKEYAQMGFLPESDSSLKTILTDFYTSFPAAFYVPGTDSIYIIQDDQLNDDALSMYISHELTHALQDQHLTMNPTVFPRYSYYSSDADLAQRALVEGDADFIEYAFVFNVLYGLGTPESFDSARLYAAQGKGNFLSADVSIDPPVFLGVKGYLPYLLGDAYVAQQYSGSGWNAINYRYSISAIPRSSAEINRTAPVTIAYFEYYAIHQLLASQSGTIEFADDDNAGFALLLGLLYGDVDSTRASRSLNWLGDRYTFIKRAEQAYGTLVWSMAFESLDGANYMFTKLDQKIRSRRLGEALPYWSGVDSVTDSSGQSTTYTYSSTLFSTKLIRTGNQVWWLENTGTLDQLIITALRQQATSPALSKVAAGGGSPLPASLSPAIKRATLAGLMRHLFTR